MKPNCIFEYSIIFIKRIFKYTLFMETLIDTYRNRLEQTNNDFVRYLMPQINWNNRLFAIVGGRGKDFTQIAGIPNSFVAADNIENRLWE